MSIEPRIRELGLGLAVLVLAAATRLPAEVARVPVMLELGHVAGRQVSPSPLFLAGAEIKAVGSTVRVPRTSSKGMR